MSSPPLNLPSLRGRNDHHQNSEALSTHNFGRNFRVTSPFSFWIPALNSYLSSLQLLILICRAFNSFALNDITQDNTYNLRNIPPDFNEEAKAKVRGMRFLLFYVGFCICFNSSFKKNCPLQNRNFVFVIKYQVC